MKEKEKLVLIGGGGHCKSVLDVVTRSDDFSEIVITDHSLPVGTMIGSIQSTDKRRDMFSRAKKTGFRFPVVIDPGAAVARTALIAPGVFIGKNAVVNADAVIEKMAIINTGAVIEHDCKVGEFTHIAVGAVVCGGVDIGKDVFVGANATVIQGVRIGMKSVIGAGSVVLDDVPQNLEVVGVPAKVIKRI